jgi:hypothetical protein
MRHIIARGRSILSTLTAPRNDDNDLNTEVDEGPCPNGGQHDDQDGICLKCGGVLY